MAVRRLALLGDVHANLPALEAVLADIARLGVHDGVVIGDLVTRGEHPEECVARIRRLGWPAVQGNTDRRATRSVDADDPRVSVVRSRAWTHHQLSTASLAYLSGLPLTHRRRLGDVRLLVTHGDTDEPVGAISEQTPTRDLTRIAGVVRAGVIVTGHTHRPHVLRAGGCVFVNPGSVGETYAPDLRPRWALLTVSGADVTVDLMAVDEPLAHIRER